MWILYLHQYFATPAMAGGTRSYEMARRLVAAGHEVNLITSDQAPPSGSCGWRVTSEAGIRVHWTPVPYDNRMGHAERIRAFVSFSWKAARRATGLGGDVVFATSTPLTIALPAVRAARRLRVVHWYKNMKGGKPCFSIYGFYIGMALGMLTNGPVGLLIPLLVGLVYLVHEKDWQAIRRM